MHRLGRMSYRRLRCCLFPSRGLLVLLCALHWAPALPAQVVIAEFLADNPLGLKDDDGDHEDWIELHNPGTTTARLDGWALTDAAGDPRKWLLPDVGVAPGGFLLVFASGKDRRSVDRPLHTNFRLDAGGEYLALVRPDGSAASAFTPTYPPQVPGVSFGFPASAVRAPLLTAGAPGRFHVPTDDTASTNWVQPDFDDGHWSAVTTGIGWDATTEILDVVIADSTADWQAAGEQGWQGWSYGTYARDADPNRSYSAGEFTEFGQGNWDGTRWRTPSAGTPVAHVGLTDGKPAGANSGGERWAIRRWRATVGGTITVQWHIAKHANGGAGVNGRLYHNGLQRDSGTLPGSGTTELTRTVTLTDVAIGDPIDLALTPLGTTGGTDDTADEATFTMLITARDVVRSLVRSDVAGLMRGRNASGYLRLPFVVTNVAELDQLELQVRFNDGFAAYLNGTPVARRNAPEEAPGGVVADQADDWAGTDDQGVKGWYYGFYDQAADPDRTYEPFGDFTNADALWAFNGVDWNLGPGNPPWTTLGRETWHPNGNTGGANVQWAIRRWVSQTAGTVKVLLAGAKESTGCGNGVTFRIFVNGTPRFSRSVDFDDPAGFSTSLVVENLAFGDFLDFALDPTGPDGDTQDACDGSTFAVQVLQDASPGLTWRSPALRPRSPAEAARLETFDLSRSRDRLHPGTNLLAFQVLSAGADDADLLLLPELSARYAQLGASNARYFAAPSPSALNTGGVETLGPVVDDLAHAPGVPADTDDLVVTARVRPTLRPVRDVTLTYRVMFAAEQKLPMFDDGAHDDRVAGDGIWGARIPASAAAPGQMIRWAVTAADTAGSALRFPSYPDPRKSPQYDGTVVADPSLVDSRIPILHWFLANPASADSDTGARGAVFYDGEFYDNVGANLHGQSTRGFPKHSYDFDFNPGSKFRWREGQPRVDDLNLLTTWADKTHFRNVLAYETYAQAGAPAHFAVAVRVQQNGKFHSLANLVENGDDNFLRRLGLDPQGALYKMYNTAGDPSGGEKKTRKTESTQDLGGLISGFAKGTAQARLAFLYDNLDVPGVVNFLAARALTGDTDCCHKNYYLYRDTNGSREWTAFPWDVDLSFGRVWTCASPCYAYYDERIYTNTGLFVGDNNTIFSAVLGTAATRQMYLRRIRTLMDELTQPPGIAPAEDRWLQRTTGLRDLLAPDAARDLAKWGTWGRRETLTQAVDRIHREFLPGRRRFLFLDRVPALLPQAQPTNAQMRIAAIEFRSGLGTSPADYVMLTNANAYAVDLSDWRLEGAVRFGFKPGTVLPARSAAFVAANRTGFRARTTSPRGGEARLVLGDFTGELTSRGGSVQLRDRTGRAVHSTDFPGAPSMAQRFLRITELMFHPPATGPAAEFVELANLGPDPLDLTGVRFTEGIVFDFTTATPRLLPPGARLVVVGDPTAFRARYGTSPVVAGQFSGSLDNAGERLRLVDGSGEPILDFRYEPSWSATADGLGFSLTSVDTEADWTAWAASNQWKPSVSPGGSPGAAEIPDTSTPSPVVIQEALTHTDPPQVDAIELHNPGTLPADISGWWLTDDAAKPDKFRLPPGTVISPGGYVVFDESHFNTPSNAPTSFRLSSHGDEVLLLSADAAGALTGYADAAILGASANGVSFGRFTNGSGAVHFVPQAHLTFGRPNGAPRSSPVVLNEIHFAPGRGDAAFVEVRNVTAQSVPLFDPAAPTHTWRLAGVDFAFPAGLSLPPGGLAVVVGGDPVVFRARHAVPADVPVLGPWSGTLEADGERLALEQPDAPDPQPDGSVIVPYLTLEEVRFRDTAPWPVTAATPGASLERRSPADWADDSTHWRAALGGPTPGQEDPGYQPWRQRYFSANEMANPEVSGDDADPDGDGQSNLSEFGSGTHPRDPASVLWLAATLEGDGVVRLRVGVVGGKTYRVEWTEALPGREWQELQHLAPEPSDRTATVTDPQPARSRPARYYRVRTP